MDAPQKPSSLPGIRTFAKDLEKKKLATSGEVPALAEKPAAAKAVLEATEASDAGHAYRAPILAKRKTGPTADPEPKKDLKKNEERPKDIPEPKLKPLSAPKAASEPTIIVDNEDAATATIIRDTKRNRFRLFPAIGTSLRSWFLGLKEKYFTKKVPKYTVPESSLRKGVIQKATSKTGKITTFDHSSLQERIRDRQDRVAPKTPSTSWSPNTEPGFLLLESPEGISNVQVEPRKSFRTIAVPPPQPESVPVPVPQVQAPVVLPTVSEPVPTPAATPTPAPLQPEPEVPAPVVTPQKSVSLVPTTRLRDWLFALNTNLMSLGLAGLVLAVTLVSAIGYFWFRDHFAEQAIVSRPDFPNLLSAPLELAYMPTLDYETVHTRINELLAANESQTIQIGVVATKDETTLVPVPALLETLGFEVSAVFGRSISTLYFGELADGTPFIVFKATDATVARGGMLAWENTLYQDTLSILAHGASAQNLPKEVAYTDIIIANTDARQLATPDGKEYLVYSLTKDNVVIITTSQTALTTLFSSLK